MNFDARKPLIVVPMRVEWSGLRVFDDFKKLNSPCLLFQSQTYGYYLLQTGIGLERAGQQLELCLRYLNVDSILHFGCAGGLSPDLKALDVVLAQNVLTTDNPPLQLVYDDYFCVYHDLTLATIFSVHQPLLFPSQKKELYKNSGAQVVDMESYAVVAVCHKFNIPCTVLRGVFDDENDHFGDVPDAVGANGNLDLIKLARELMFHPAKILHLPKWHARSKKLNQKMAKLVLAWVEVSTNT